jgi:hypothetical protein
VPVLVTRASGIRRMWSAAAFKCDGAPLGVFHNDSRNVTRRGLHESQPPRCCSAPRFAATVARGINLAIKSAVSGPSNGGAWSVKFRIQGIYENLQALICSGMKLAQICFGHSAAERITAQQSSRTQARVQMRASGYCAKRQAQLNGFMARCTHTDHLTGLFRLGRRSRVGHKPKVANG